MATKRAPELIRVYIAIAVPNRERRVPQAQSKFIFRIDAHTAKRGTSRKMKIVKATRCKGTWDVGSEMLDT